MSKSDPKTETTAVGQVPQYRAPPAEPKWLETIKRTGLIVGLLGGLLGGSKTVADLVTNFLSAPVMSFRILDELTLQWNEASRRLTVDCGLQIKNDGTAFGRAERPTASLRYRRSNGDLIDVPLADVNLTLDGYIVDDSDISTRPQNTTSLAMQASTKLTVDQEKEIISEPRKFELLVDVAFTGRSRKSYCFWVEKKTLVDLKRGELKVTSPSKLCFDLNT